MAGTHKKRPMKKKAPKKAKRKPMRKY